MIPFVRGGLASEVHRLGEDINAEFVDLTGNDTGYHSLLAGLWAEGQSFVVVEQDILPGAAQLDEMWNCPEGWCTSAYPYAINTGQGVHVGQGPTFGLGCVKFSAALLARESDLFSVERLASPVHWLSIDSALADPLGSRGYRPHRHSAVRHLRVEAMLGKHGMLPA